eukprot:TRINITY_DN1835_c0_g1_i1.p1 TRINITY_DN1835_c0_g1~~TRINITY_DN1835_c0_g1_i1.p1  ORF type:complete len:281 (+),score=62.16 TRINITY_DN1835_c0_g1_i1:285-1127(+)
MALIPFFERQKIDAPGRIAVKLEILLIATCLFNLITIIVYSTGIGFTVTVLLEIIFYLVLALGFLSAYKRNLSGLLVYIVIYVILIVIVGLAAIFVIFFLSIFGARLCDDGYCTPKHVTAAVFLVLFCLLNLVDFHYALRLRNAFVRLSHETNAQFPMQTLPQYVVQVPMQQTTQQQTIPTPYYAPTTTFVQQPATYPQQPTYPQQTEATFTPQNETIVHQNNIHVQVSENVSAEETKHANESNEESEHNHNNNNEEPIHGAAVLTTDENASSYTTYSLL